MNVNKISCNLGAFSQNEKSNVSHKHYLNRTQCPSFKVKVFFPFFGLTTSDTLLGLLSISGHQAIIIWQFVGQAGSPILFTRLILTKNILIAQFQSFTWELHVCCDIFNKYIQKIQKKIIKHPLKLFSLRFIKI